MSKIFRSETKEQKCERGSLMEDNTGRVSSDSWFGRRRKCSRVGRVEGQSGRWKRRRGRKESREEELRTPEEVRREQDELLYAAARPAE